MLVGYCKEVILDYFLNKDYEWDIKIVDIGEDIDMVGCIYNCCYLLCDKFLVIYGDGICDVEVNKIIEFYDLYDGFVILISVFL